MSQKRDNASDILLWLLRCALVEGYNEQLYIAPGSKPDWEQVGHIASSQGVGAIAWDGLCRAADLGLIAQESMPSKATKLKWIYSIEQLTKRYQRQRSVICKLAQSLGSKQIRVMVLKGYGLSLTYPRPEHRACGDVDIWLFDEQRRGDELLKSEFNIAIDTDKHHHTVFYLDGVMVENHYDFVNTHSRRSNKHIERILKELAHDAIEIEVDGSKIYIPNANCHALFLLRHAAAHFAAAEIALRHIIDWAMFVKRYHGDIDWAWLNEISKRFNMHRFLWALNSLAVELCGIEREWTHTQERNTEIEQRILNDIFSPEFVAMRPERGTLRIVLYKLRRWWANRWKRELVYNESNLSSFITQSWSHILKPKSIKH